MDISEIVFRFQNAMKYSDSKMLDLTLEYIDNQDNNYLFDDFLLKKAKDYLEGKK